MRTPKHNPRTPLVAMALLLGLLPLSALPAQPLAAPEQMSGHTLRTLTGTVTDPHHEPLKGAVVKLQTGDTSNITTYITGADGRYVFKRLDGNVDYKVWATFRERTSKPREISKFDNNMDKEIDFTLETF
jgi:hypothetical protein